MAKECYLIVSSVKKDTGMINLKVPLCNGTSNIRIML